MFLKGAWEGCPLELRWLVDDSRSCSLAFVNELASALATKGFFSEAHVRTRELMMLVEKGSGVQLPSDHLLTSEDMGLLEKLGMFYSTGRAEFRGKISFSVESEIEPGLLRRGDCNV
jgi:hypothetical protein